MAGTKRSWEGETVNADVTMSNTREESPRSVQSIFEHFRSELDEHHDRRERIIKASRDITALSKKVSVVLSVAQMVMIWRGISLASLPLLVKVSIC
jgi:hypothetical protein